MIVAPVGGCSHETVHAVRGLLDRKLGSGHAHFQFVPRAGAGTGRIRRQNKTPMPRRM